MKFDLIRACCYLLAAVLMVAMTETLIALGTCAWLMIVQQPEPADCGSIGSNVRDVVAEAITAVLALLAVQRRD